MLRTATLYTELNSNLKMMAVVTFPSVTVEELNEAAAAASKVKPKAGEKTLDVHITGNQLVFIDAGATHKPDRLLLRARTAAEAIGCTVKIVAPPPRSH